MINTSPQPLFPIGISPEIIRFVCYRKFAANRSYNWVRSLKNIGKGAGGEFGRGPRLFEHVKEVFNCFDPTKNRYTAYDSVTVPGFQEKGLLRRGSRQFRKRKEDAKMKAMRLSSICVSSVIVMLVTLAITPAIGAEDIKPRVLVDYARLTIDNFIADPDMTWVRTHMKDAKGVLIVPRLGKGAFMVGGSGGRGVLLARDEKTGKWSEPAFYSLGSVSFGFQIGGQASEVILMVMGQRGLERLYTSSVKLGADFSIAAGPVGVGAAAKGVTAVIVSFARAKGAFAGGSLEGAVIKVTDKWNSAYYGKPVRPVDIFVTRAISNPHSAELQKALRAAEKKGEQELAAMGPARFVYAKTTINIRRGPGTNYSVLRKATKGEELEYISLEGDWYKLNVAEGKPQEWVHKSVVVAEKP